MKRRLAPSSMQKAGCDQTARETRTLNRHVVPGIAITAPSGQEVESSLLHDGRAPSPHEECKARKPAAIKLLDFSLASAGPFQ